MCICILINIHIFIYICIDYVGNDLVLFALKHGLVLSLLVRSQNAEEVGRINYVPITAVQRFDMEKKFIRNGVLWRKFHFWQQLGDVDLKKKHVLKTSLEEQLVSRASECVTEICFCTAYFVCTVACCGCLFYVLFFTDIHCCMFFIPGAEIFALMKSSCSTFSWVSRDFYNPNFELEQSI